jgi:predicted nucleotidyltransferase
MSRFGNGASRVARCGDVRCLRDVDLAWVVPDGEVQEHAERLRDILGVVADVASLRSDPDFQRAEHRRLIFVRFAGLPLFWRSIWI